MTLLVVLSELLCSLMFSGPKSDNAAVLAAFGRAEVYVEKSYNYYCRMHNYMYLEYQDGKTDIYREDWDAVVLPLSDKIAMNLDQAMAELESVMPAPNKIKRGDFWSKVYYGVFKNWEFYRDFFREMNFYQSEYLMRVFGYPSYLYMYLALTDNKFENIESSLAELREQAETLKK